MTIVHDVDVLQRFNIISNYDYGCLAKIPLGLLPTTISMSFSEVQLPIVKGPSLLHSSNQEINPSVGSQQFLVEDLVKVSTPNKFKPPSPQPQPKPIVHSNVAIRKELILKASVELEKDMNDEEVEEEGSDKDEMEEGEESEELEGVGGPINPQMKNLESFHASKSKKVMKSPLKKTTKKVKKLVAKHVGIATTT